MYKNPKANIFQHHEQENSNMIANTTSHESHDKLLFQTLAGLCSLKTATHLPTADCVAPDPSQQHTAKSYADVTGEVLVLHMRTYL
jgi:predicted small lipoprotein YifL